MDASVVVALITSLVSLVIAALGAAWTRRQQRELTAYQSQSGMDLEKLKHALERSAKIEDRLSDETARFAVYREPLLAAANELGDRIDNIQNRRFLFYLSVQDHRSSTALLSTLYRFANYFARAEALYSKFGLMRFHGKETQGEVVDLIGHIGRTFSTDQLDWDGRAAGARFMFWREEQRAIGELMLDTSSGQPDDQPAHAIGYASFVEAYDERFARWFAPLVDGLRSYELAVTSERLARLRRLLAKLVIKLDEEGHYAHLGEDGWIARSATGGPASQDDESEV